MDRGVFQASASGFALKPWGARPSYDALREHWWDVLDDGKIEVDQPYHGFSDYDADAADGDEAEGQAHALADVEGAERDS